MATGGGAYKYYDVLRQKLGVEVSREDEMECLIMGVCVYISKEGPYPTSYIFFIPFIRPSKSFFFFFGSEERRCYV
jgi:hypothetical protein